MTSNQDFADTARRLSLAARGAGLTVPAFRSPPRKRGVDRTLRRTAGSVVVAVRIRDRDARAVYLDMIEGVISANRLAGESADRVRAALRAALEIEMTGAELYEEHTGRT